MDIGPKMIEQVKAQIGELLDSCINPIDKAYRECDNELSVSLSVKFSPSGRQGVVAQVGISFVESKIKKVVRFEID